MCGITGLLRDGSDDRDRLIRRMAGCIVHRGPDAGGFHEDDRAALAIRRLAIIDVAHGEQPVYDESRSIVVVFNGEIYNYRALRETLLARGHILASESDSECIPHLYEEFGDDFVTHLRGMFAIALWDRRRGRLLLARDRLGKKPLYYRTDGDGIAFGSELKSLLADPSLRREVDPAALSHYLTYQYVPAPFSIYEGVAKLPPAHVLAYENGRVQTWCYWRLRYPAAGAPDPRTEEDLAEELRTRLLESVRVRLMSERPLGAFLSGGLDSSAIVAAMSRTSSDTVRTFSIGFEDESHNELPYARQVADLYGTEHHELVVHPDVEDLLPTLARGFDEPFADSSAIPSYYLAQMAREHVVVALNGDGGDEALGGYTRYARFLSTPTRTLPRPVAAGLGAGGRLLAPLGSHSAAVGKVSRAALLLADSHPARRYGRFVSYFRPEEKRLLFSPVFANRVRHVDSYALVERLWDEYGHTDAVNRLLAVDTHSYLPGDLLAKVDITTMAVSLEARSPLLDHEFVEWTATLPGRWKVQGGTTKYLFKKALAPWLPDRLIHREKMGFGIPLAAWLRGPLKATLNDALTDATARDRGWFDPGAVRSLIDQHMSGLDHSARLYALLMLELWAREVHGTPAEGVVAAPGERR